MQTLNISVDFHRTIGEIKPLHGVNNSPLSLLAPPPGFQEAGIPFCRLHDAAGPYGGAHYVDIPNIFTDFDADAADPEAYDFAFTDAYLKQLHASGTEIFYRLGVTIENNFRIKGYQNHPPKDFNKWADICAGIVRHYNEGWANGFHLGIRYWEIWNEPENPPMWSGTREQYFELYRITANRLKQEFPHLRVGGYAGCGFYAVTRPNMTEFYKSFVDYFDQFLAYVTAPETRSPLDFYSWHLYTGDPTEIVRHAEYVAAKLRQYHLDKTENIFNEWNYMSDDIKRRFDLMKGPEGASFVAAAFALLQNSPVDKAMYYDAYPQRAYCGLYYFPSQEPTPTYYAFKAFNELYRLKRQCAATGDHPKVHVCAAGDGSNGAILLANIGKSRVRIRLDIAGADSVSCCRLIDRRHTFQSPAHWDGRWFDLPGRSVMLLTTGPDQAGSEPLENNPKLPRVHAGIDQGN